MVAPGSVSEYLVNVLAGNMRFSVELWLSFWAARVIATHTTDVSTDVSHAVSKEYTDQWDPVGSFPGTGYINI